MDEKLYGFFCKKHGYLNQFEVTSNPTSYICSECLTEILDNLNLKIIDISIDIKELSLKDKEVNDE